MSDIPEQNIQVDEAQAQVGGNAEVETLKAEIQKLSANNAKLLGEKKNQSTAMEELQRKTEELLSQQAKSRRTKLEEKEEWKPLYDDLTKSYESLKAELSESRQAYSDLQNQHQQESLRAQALNAFSKAGCHAPDHLFSVLEKNLKQVDGQPVFLNGGVQVSLDEHVNALKQSGSGLDYFFQGTQARGMGAVGSTPAASGGQNPYATGNFAAVIELEMSDPQRAAQLKAQAGL